MRFLLLDHVPSSKWARWAPYAAILLGALILNLDGWGRSLWLDEAWVANSVHEPTLAGMFHYPEWFQTTPPLFLFVARLLTHFIGFSTVSLRLTALLFALIAAGVFLAVLRRVVKPPIALLAAVLLVFHPLPVEYFRSFKQYGGEIAATTLLLFTTVRYLRYPGRSEFGWLLLSTLLLSLSYPLAFLFPGILLAVWFTDRMRAVVLAAAGAVVLGFLYVVFIRPNVSPALWTFWKDNPDPQYGGGATVIAIVAAVVAYALWRKREWTMLICLLPCALLLLAEISGWYPVSPRTRLFVRPCFLMALAFVANDLFRRWTIVATLAAVIVMGWGFYKQFSEGRGQAFEDYIAAVHFLHDNVATGDIVLVHPSAREGFRLYTDIESWHPAAIYGDTGWPCCPREHAAAPRSSSEDAVRRDLEAKVAAGRVWLLSTSRDTHWKYTGLNEVEMWRKLLAARGCVAGKDAHPANLLVLEMTCSPNSP